MPRRKVHRVRSKKPAVEHSIRTEAAASAAAAPVPSGQLASVMNELATAAATETNPLRFLLRAVASFAKLD